MKTMSDRAAFALGTVCLVIGALAGSMWGPSANEAAAPAQAYERERCLEGETLIWLDDRVACVATDSLPPR